MTSVNRVTLIGHLGRDPETRYTGGGKPVCNFSLATETSFKTQDGNRTSKTEWHKIVCWDKLAEICQQYLRKGSLVYVEGKIQSRAYQDKTTGANKQSFEINISEMKMLDKKTESVSAAAAGASSENGQVEITDEDIPF